MLYQIICFQLTVTQGYLPQENPFPSISEWSFFQRHSKVLVQIVRRCQRQKIQTRQSAVLLSGKRGIGKRLLARLVAYKTGIHLYEVSVAILIELRYWFDIN